MQTSNRAPTMELMHEIMAAFNSRDADRIVSYFAEDCTFYMASGPEWWPTSVARPL